MSVLKKIFVSLILIFSFFNLVSCTPSKVLINFDTNGGTPIASIRVDYNDVLPRPVDPFRFGSTFKYWSLLGEEKNTEYDFNFRVKSSFTLFAQWDDDYTSEGLEYRHAGSNTDYYIVSKGSVCATNAPVKIAIPAIYNGLPVTSIDTYGFYKCTNITSIMMADNVERINSYAFAENDNLSTIFLSSSITRIWDGAFRDCKNLKAITIPDNVTSLDPYVFADCTSLESISLPNNITTINSYAFYNCTMLTSIMIPDSVKWIGNYAFYNCNRLISIQIPSNVIQIGNKAFYDCDSLISISIPGSVTTIGALAFGDLDNLIEFFVANENLNYQSQDGVLFSKGRTTLIAYPVKNSRTSYSIPRTVTAINDYAFHKSYNLSVITFETGSQLKTIGIGTFADCVNLIEITIPEEVAVISANAFANCLNLKTVLFATGSKLEVIGSYAFYNCISLSTLYIPLTVTTINSFAFANCRSLISLTIPNSVIIVGSAIFSGWTNNQDINISVSLQHLDGWISTWNFDCDANIHWID